MYPRFVLDPSGLLRQSGIDNYMNIIKHKKMVIPRISLEIQRFSMNYLTLNLKKSRKDNSIPP